MKFFCRFILCLFFLSVVFAAKANTPVVTSCLVPAKTQVVVCESGGPFLCVNTPPGGVKENFLVIQGLLNLSTSTLGELSIATQQEYTKQLKNISLSDPLTENCWGQNLTPEKNFCLEKGGAFAARVPLADLGPYTILVAASRMQGESVQATVRVSHVIAPVVTSDLISYDPDVKTGVMAKPASHVRVVLDLLAGCGESKENCDFIGASTGGVVVTIENQMVSVPPKTVQCETNTVQEGAGRFVIGMPVEAGSNQLTIHVCNAATGFDSSTCPKIISPAFTVGGVASQIQVLSPLADGPFLWDSLKNPVIPLRFKIAGADPKTCDDSVHVTLNLQQPAKVCANAEGIYEMPLVPEEGYNIVSIEAVRPDQKLIETISFGWGKPLSPFDAEGRVRPEGEWSLSHAAQFWLSESFWNQLLLPELQKFLSSEKFKTWLVSATENIGRGGAAPSTGLRVKVTEAPQIGKIEIHPLQFAEGQIQLGVHIENFSIGIQLYKDENNDNIPDADPLPLKIAFKELDLAPILQNGGRLSSAYTDCDYKRSDACRHIPALFVPQHFKGGASPAGAFVTCDRSQKISSHMDSLCHALNVVDRQTGGFFQEKILDTFNNAYASLEAGAFIKGIPWNQEIAGFSFHGLIGLDDLNIQKSGMMIVLKTGFGNEAWFSQWPENLRKRGAGILVGGPPSKPLMLTGDPEEISFGLALPVISQMFWGVHDEKNGMAMLVMDDDFFRKLGLDFAAACDVPPDPKKGANPLCNIRPRAQEILGDPITQYGYLDSRAPLRLVFTPSPVFPFRLHVLDADAGLIELSFADWELAIESGARRFIVAKLSAKIALQISPPTFDPQQPESLLASLKIVADKSRFWVSEKEGTNTTIIPGPVLLSKLGQVLGFAIDNYSKAGREIKLPIPRGFDFSSVGLDLPKLVWGATGLDLGWDSSGDRILLHSVPILINKLSLSCSQMLRLKGSHFCGFPPAIPSEIFADSKNEFGRFPSSSSKFGNL